MKKPLANALLFLVTCSLCALLCELLVRWTSSYKDPTEMVARTLTTTLDDYLSQENPCTFQAKLIPHPYLTMVYGQERICEDTANTDGFPTREFPGTNPPETFDVAVLGGSVASHMSAGPGGELGEVLHAYQDSSGRAVKIYSASHGMWKQPQQLFTSLLFQNSFDAIISIEGYNENNFLQYPWHSLALPVHFHYTFGVFSDLNIRYPVSLGNFLKGLYRKHEFLRKSYAFTFFYVRMRAILESIIVSAPKGTASLMSFQREGNELDFESYHRYLSQLHRVSLARKQKLAVFLQPVPGIGKKLTPEEESYLQPKKFYDQYQDLVKYLTAKDPIPVYPLLDVFEDVGDQIYQDSVHAIMVDGRSRGYRLMSERIADILSKEWGIRKVR